MVTTGLTTIDDLIQLDDKHRYDLIRGELIQMSPAGRRHGRIAATLARLIGNYVTGHDLGEVHGAETGFILARDPDTLLAPDVAFVRVDRLTPDLDQDGFLPLAPDLAVEIVSPSDRMNDVTEKVMIYLDAGVSLVWIVQPRQKTVTVYQSDRTARIFREGDDLGGSDVLPGLSLPVESVFS